MEEPKNGAASAPASTVPAPASIAPAPAPAPAGSGASAPAAEGVAQCEPVRHKAHHSYVWLGSIRAVIMFVGIAFVASLSSLVGFVAEDLSDPGGVFVFLVVTGIIVGCIVLAAACIVVYQVVSYKYLYFTLGSDEFSLYRGIISKKRVHVPYRRIQSVDQRASLLQRVFGVCAVLVDTAGGSANKAVTIPYLTKQQAEWLRAELFARKRGALAGASSQMAFGQATAPGSPVAARPRAAEGNVLDAGAAVWSEFGGVFGGAELDTGYVSYEYGLSNKELLFAGLSGNTSFFIAIAGVIGAVSQIVPVLIGMFPRAGEDMVESVAAQMAGGLAGSFIAMIALAVLAAALVLWLVSALGTCISYGGFKARRRGSRIEVERGLLQHVFQGVDVERVQSVTIEQTLIRRLMGYCRIVVGKIDAASDGDEAAQSPVSQGVVVHPFVKMSRVPEILAGLVPEYADVPRQAIPVAPVALRRALLRRCLWMGAGFYLALGTAACQVGMALAGTSALASAFGILPSDVAALRLAADVVFAIMYALALIIIVIDAVGAVLWSRESSFAYNERFMQVTNGGLTRTSVSFPRKKIQFGDVRTNPLQRAAGTATVEARIAAGVGGTTLSLIDAREDDAGRWLAWLKPGGNVVE